MGALDTLVVGVTPSNSACLQAMLTMKDHPPTATGGNPQPLLRAVAFGLTDRGMQREHNEDSFLVLGDYNLFIVADGMGGHRAGDVASKIATSTIAEFFRSTANEDVTWPFHFDTNLTEEENRLVTGIRVANRQILDKSERSRECQGMGTTVVGAMYSPSKNRVFIGHVGDSRCYRVRDGAIKLLTRDHSLVNDYITAMPDLTDEQKAELPKNVITRALGMQKDVLVDLQGDEPQANDVYVLCSDGLNGMLRDDEILGAVQEHPADLTAAARRLIDLANANGGEDNITVVLIRLEEDRAVSPFATTINTTQAALGEGFAEDETVATKPSAGSDDSLASQPRKAKPCDPRGPRGFLLPALCQCCGLTSFQFSTETQRHKDTKQKFSYANMHSQKYHAVTNNCTDPIERGLSLDFNALLPTGLAQRLNDRAIQQTFYPAQARSPLGLPWSLAARGSFWSMY